MQGENVIDIQEYAFKIFLVAAVIAVFFDYHLSIIFLLGGVSSINGCGSLFEEGRIYFKIPIFFAWILIPSIFAYFLGVDLFRYFAFDVVVCLLFLIACMFIRPRDNSR